MEAMTATPVLPSSLHTDRGSRYRTTPEAGGKVDRDRPTQFGRAMRQLGVQMIPAHSPEARARCERMFGTHRGRLPRELAARGIDTMDGANRYLAEHYRAAFNAEFAVPAPEQGGAFVPFIGPGLADILCEHHERTVNRDHCVSFRGRRLQIPAQAHRRHFIKARVRVHRYPDGRLAVFHGPRKLADYTLDGALAAETIDADPGRRTAEAGRVAVKRIGACKGARMNKRPQASGPDGRAMNRVLPWGCGRVLRTGARPAGRGDSPWTTLTRCPPPAPTRAPLAHEPHRTHNKLSMKRKTGQPLCYKTGQLYLLATP